MSREADLDGAVIGVDVGGTTTHAAAFDQRFNLITDVEASTLTGGTDLVWAGIIETITPLLFNGHRIEGVGICLPGVVDSSAGSVRHAVNLGIGEDALNIVSRLNTVIKVPCWIANDVHSAALGVYEVFGRGGCGSVDLIYLSIGTGIAAGVILNGSIYRGHNGVSGDIGHFSVDPDGPQCACGLKGCLEAVASGAALSQQWPRAGRHSSVEALFSAVDGGDENAALVLERAAEHLARAIHVLVLTFDIDRIVIGGGVADVGGSSLMDAVRKSLLELQRRSPFTQALNLAERVMLKPPEPVGVIGAAALTCRSRSL